VQKVEHKLGRLDGLLGMLEQLQVPLAKVREHLDLPGMRTEQALNFRDKARMKNLLRAAGLPCAKHRLVASVREGVEFARELGGPLVLKPQAGAGAVSTYRANSVEEVVETLGGMQPSAERPVLCEEFILGEERSLEVISIDGEPVWHSITHYSPPPLEVLRNPWIQWTVLLPREVEHPRYDDAREAGFAALKVLGQGTGISHMEWFRRRDGSIAISEIAARPPGAQIMALMSHSTGRSFFDVWAELMIHDRFRGATRTHAAGVAFLRGMGRGRVYDVHGLDVAQKAVGGLVVDVNLPKKGAPAKPGYEGEGWAIVKAPETATVQHALDRIIRNVRVELR
jgi:biotin carboxylase